MSRFLLIKDEHSKIFGHRILNSQLTLYLGLIQLVICFWSLAQHLYSMIALKKVLHCDFSANSSLPGLLTAVDVIIFDVGLFHSLWGIDGCVAEHLDGGYGRFAWCISHSASLIYCLPFAFVRRPKPHHLWPLLIQQSAYGIGLLILSLAALPRVLPTFMGDLSNAPLHALLVYAIGALLNFFLLFVLYHWYWHVEEWSNSARKVSSVQLQRSHNRRTGQPSIPTPGNIDFAPLISRQVMCEAGALPDTSIGLEIRQSEAPTRSEVDIIVKKESQKSICHYFTPAADEQSLPLYNGEICAEKTASAEGGVVEGSDDESSSTPSAAAEHDFDNVRPLRTQPFPEYNQGRRVHPARPVSPAYLEVPPMLSPILKSTCRAVAAAAENRNLSSRQCIPKARKPESRKTSIASGSSLAGNSSVLSHGSRTYPTARTMPTRAKYHTPTAIAPIRRCQHGGNMEQKSDAQPMRRIVPHRTISVQTHIRRCSSPFNNGSGGGYGYLRPYGPISKPTSVNYHGRHPVGYVSQQEYRHPRSSPTQVPLYQNYYAGGLRPNSQHAQTGVHCTTYGRQLIFHPIKRDSFDVKSFHIQSGPQEDYYRSCRNYWRPSRFL